MPILGRLAVAAALVAALAWPARAAADGQALEFWTGDPPRLVHSLVLAPGAVIQLDHVNSIYDAPVRETYICGSHGLLIQVAMESPSAAVLEYHGYDPTPSGKVFLERPLREIRLLSSSFANHRLTIGEVSLGLEPLARAGLPLVLKIGGVSAAPSLVRP